MTDQRKLERNVGIFVALGIVVICSLTLYFGKVGDRFRGGFPITVDFSNAGGLVSGAQVLYAGVLVGKVDEIHLKKDGNGVEVELNLFKGTSIRKDAKFLIKQSGLLGDQHIVVVPVSNDAPILESGATVKGSDPFDFSDVAGQAGEAIKKLNTAINRLSTDLMDSHTLDHAKKGVKNFADLMAKLQTNSDRINVILRNAEKGKGTVGKLLTDDQLFTELKQLIHNWRVHGLLYSEKGEERYPSPRQTTNKPTGIGGKKASK